MIAKAISRLQELFRFREMFFGLVSREIRARYKGSMLGFLWTLLNPLLMMMIYSIIFANFMRIEVPNYSLFLFVGLLPWSWFNTSILNATSCIVNNSGLIRKLYFPTEILPTVNVVTNLVNYLLSLPILVGFMIYYRTPLTWALLELPLLIFVQFLLTLGISFVLATANVYYRDVEQLLGALLLAWFYLTPVIYAESLIPQKFRPYFLLNPLAPLISGYHQIFINGKWLTLTDLLYPVTVGLVIFAIGYFLFNRQRFNFAEVV